MMNIRALHNNVKFADWVLNAGENEVVAWEGSGAQKEDDTTIRTAFKHRLFARCYPLNINGNNNIEKIKLPYCPNIHVFSLSFGK